METLRKFDVPYPELEHGPPCFCRSCAEKAGEQDIWERLLISQLAYGLQQRDEYLDWAETNLPDEGRKLAFEMFEVGFAMGRIFSEYKVKTFIEPLALAGQEHEANARKRLRASGEASSKMRAARMESLLDHMETLAKENPALARLGPDALASLATEDASASDPHLWSQGRGQVSEYLGCIRRGEAGAQARKRYAAIFS